MRLRKVLLALTRCVLHFLNRIEALEAENAGLRERLAEVQQFSDSQAEALNRMERGRM